MLLAAWRWARVWSCRADVGCGLWSRVVVEAGDPEAVRAGTYPNGDYYLHLTHDLRLGTFGHPWEQTLTVWGSSLLTAVQAELSTCSGNRSGAGTERRRSAALLNARTRDHSSALSGPHGEHALPGRRRRGQGPGHWGRPGLR